MIPWLNRGIQYGKQIMYIQDELPAENGDSIQYLKTTRQVSLGDEACEHGDYFDFGM